MTDAADLEAIAEGDERAAWIVEYHVSSDTQYSRCVLCGERWPCDEASLAALAVLRAREADRLRAENARLRAIIGTAGVIEGNADIDVVALTQPPDD